MSPRGSHMASHIRTKENTNYRSVAWSGRYLQLTLMSIPAGSDIGLEAHPETDQFLRLDAGNGRVQMGPAKDKLTFEKEVLNGWCVLVPAGTWHNIPNTGTTPMQVYTIYAPAHHTPDKVQAMAAAAEADKDDEPAAWSVQPKHAPDKHGRPQGIRKTFAIPCSGRSGVGEEHRQAGQV